MVAMMLVYMHQRLKSTTSSSKTARGQTLRRYLVSSVGTAALTGDRVESHSTRDVTFAAISSSAGYDGNEGGKKDAKSVSRYLLALK